MSVILAQPGNSRRESLHGRRVACPVVDAKRALREEMRRRLAALPNARRCTEEDLVTAAIQDTPEWRAARTVLLYRSVSPEFSTVGLANGAWRAGKRVAFPRITPTALVLHEVRAWHEFTGTTHGIPEPGAALAVVDPASVDLAIVPGVAWDDAGRRLGRGGGFYDRLLPKLRLAWGIGFDIQRVPAVPAEGHDWPVHRVWTGSSVLES